MKPDVVLRHLSIAVAANDQSYMPQQVTVAVGRNASSLQEVRDVHIPSNITGYVTLLENANISQMCESIKIPLAYCSFAFYEGESLGRSQSDVLQCQLLEQKLLTLLEADKWF